MHIRPRWHSHRHAGNIDTRRLGPGLRRLPKWSRTPRRPGRDYACFSPALKCRLTVGPNARARCEPAHISGCKFPISTAQMCKEGCLTLVQLGAAAFVDTSAEIVRSKWVLRDGRALLAALSAGTVRMAAVIAAQEP